MDKHPYTLEKGSKKFICPNCGKKSLKRYIDTKTGDYLPEHYGRCDHENSCVPHYHLNPYLDGYAKEIWQHEKESVSKFHNNWKQNKKIISQPQHDPIFFDYEIFKKTLQPERYEKNTFIQNLLNNVQYPFEIEDIIKAIQLYRLGTVANGYRAGANTFPFIDIKGNVRAVQVKQFDEQNHTTGTDFLHSIIEKHHTRNNKPLPEWLETYLKQNKMISCLFGEHLLCKYPSASVYLFEAPKTAVYSTLYFGHPDNSNVICLAVYNKSSFSLDKLKVLQGRFIFIFPDLSVNGKTYKEWETKAKNYESQIKGAKFIFSDHLELHASDEQREKGADIADILIKMDWRKFRKMEIEQVKSQNEPRKVEIFKTDRLEPIFDIEPIKKELELWDIAELETFFKNVPNQKIKVSNCETILGTDLFVKSHLDIIKHNNGKEAFLPYYQRLKNLLLLIRNNRDP